MSCRRDVDGTKARAIRALEAYPELGFAEIAAMAGISRMHLYRLATRFSEVRSAYRFCLFLKKAKADDLMLEAVVGIPHGHRRVYAAAQDSMRYEYYLNRWERRRESWSK